MTRPISTLRSRLPTIAAWCLLLLLAACARVPIQQAPRLSTAQIRAEIVRRLPTDAPDRMGWATDIQTAFGAQGIDPGPENICAVLAVIAQESGFQADPAIPDLPRIAREEIDRRAAAHHIRNLWSMRRCGSTRRMAVHTATAWRTSAPNAS